MHAGTNGRIVFLRRLTGYGVGYWSAGGHDQRPVRSRKNRAERLDHTAIVLAVLDESREVVGRDSHAPVAAP